MYHDKLGYSTSNLINDLHICLQMTGILTSFLFMCILQADNILKILGDCLQPGFLTNIDDFTAAISKDATYKPYGEKIHAYTVKKGTYSFLLGYGVTHVIDPIIINAVTAVLGKQHLNTCPTAW